MPNLPTGTHPVEIVTPSKIDHECRTLRRMLWTGGLTKERHQPDTQRNIAAFQQALTPFLPTIAGEMAIAMDGIFRRHWKVRFWDDPDEQNRVKDEIEDYLYGKEDELDVRFTPEQTDFLIGAVMKTARYGTSDYAKKQCCARQILSP